MLAQTTPLDDGSAAARLLILLAAVLVGLLFIRLLIAIGRLVVGMLGLVRLVISRLFLLLVALALLAAALTSNLRLTGSFWAQDGSLQDLPIARQQQDRHIKGTPQYRLRLQLGKPTSRWDDPTEADPLTREAWQKGAAVWGTPRLRDWDAGRRIGADPDGGSLTHIRVSQDKQGRIHGWPAARAKAVQCREPHR
jgi:hypothetical protein